VAGEVGGEGGRVGESVVDALRNAELYLRCWLREGLMGSSDWIGLFSVATLVWEI
jgi:hypothetical protein